MRLAISVLVTFVVPIGAACRMGALVKDGLTLEALGRIHSAALDTGSAHRIQLSGCHSTTTPLDLEASGLFI